MAGQVSVLRPVRVWPRGDDIDIVGGRDRDQIGHHNKLSKVGSGLGAGNGPEGS